MNVAVAVVAVLDPARFELGHRLAHVLGDGSRLGIRHESARPERPAELADLGHQRRVSDGDVPVERLATGLDRRNQLRSSDEVGPRLLRRPGVVALGESDDPNRLAGAVGKGDGSPNPLVGLLGIYPEHEGGLDRLIE